MATNPDTQCKLVDSLGACKARAPQAVQHLVQYFTQHLSLLCPARWSCAQYRRRRTRLYFRNIACNKRIHNAIDSLFQVQCESSILATLRSTTINQFPSLNTNNKIPNFVELKYLSDHTPKKGVSLADKRVKRAGKSEDLKFMHKAILTKFEYNNVKHLKQILLACWYICYFV